MQLHAELRDYHNYKGTIRTISRDRQKLVAEIESNSSKYAILLDSALREVVSAERKTSKTRYNYYYNCPVTHTRVSMNWIFE